MSTGSDSKSRLRDNVLGELARPWQLKESHFMGEIFEGY